MKNIGVLTSGGDSPGMNAAIRSVVRAANYYGMQAFGISRGYEGLLDEEIRPMGATDVSDIIQRGGTILQTARSKAFKESEGQVRAAEILKNRGIEGLVVIGGDGSLTGALKLSELGIRIMGLPGTIDNDLAYTDETIGFDTAVNTVLGAISNVRDTTSSHGRCIVIEVMGRHCGDIALHAGICGGAEIILIPEEPVDIDAMCKTISDGKKRGKHHCIVVRAEGVDISTSSLVDVIKLQTGMDTREVVLGYIQRGGSPTARDRMLASQMGMRAVELLSQDGGSRAIGIKGGKIVDFDLKEALEMKKEPPEEIVKLQEALF